MYFIIIFIIGNIIGFGAERVVNDYLSNVNGPNQTNGLVLHIPIVFLSIIVGIVVEMTRKGMIFKSIHKKYFRKK